MTAKYNSDPYVIAIRRQISRRISVNPTLALVPDDFIKKMLKEEAEYKAEFYPESAEAPGKQ